MDRVVGFCAGLAALGALSTMAHDHDMTLVVAAELHATLGEASGLVCLPGGAFLVADDRGSVRLVTVGADGDAHARDLFDDARSLDGLEGLTRVGDDVIGVREHDGAVVGFAAPTAVRPPGPLRVRGTLSRPLFDVASASAAGGAPGGANADNEKKGKKRDKTKDRAKDRAKDKAKGGKKTKAKKNKGFEGLTFLPGAAAFDGRDHLVAVHEGYPRALSLFAWPSLTPEQSFVIEGDLDDALPDLSGVAFDRRRGELWIVSDEAEAVARVQLSTSGLRLVAVHPLPVDDGEKPEGIDFDDDGEAWIVTDDSGRLLRLSRPDVSRR